jgi:hypothetical protein
MFVRLAAFRRAHVASAASPREKTLLHIASMSHPLEALRARIESVNDPDMPFEDVERLTVVTCGEGHHVEFYGSCFDENYTDLCETLCQREVAASLLSLSLRGPDEGANGTQSWDLEPLVTGEPIFARLQTFAVELQRPAAHNCPIIGASDSYEEAGVIARFVAQCPALAYLTVPSAPSPEFFAVPLPELRFLSVDAGYAPQDFLRNFAGSSGFASLRTFEWGEYANRHADDWPAACTPFEDYAALFAAPAFRSVMCFVLRQPMLTVEQLGKLRQLRPDIQFTVTRSSHEYVGR